jgi:UDP-glucose 6-dehydrogenase
MKTTVVGPDYVGLVSEACIAEVGNGVLSFNLDVEKIQPHTEEPTLTTSCG